MSNFSFLKIQNKYTQNDAFHKMVDYVFMAEKYFYVMDIACAQYVRYSIEQYVEYVSALYRINYSIHPLRLAHYLYGDNAKRLIDNIGQYAFSLLHSLNDISKTYCHVGIPRSDEKYNDMIVQLYDLMADLYLTITGDGMGHPGTFSYDKIDSIDEIDTPNGKKMKIVPSEAIVHDLPEKEPISLNDTARIQYVDYENYLGSEEEKIKLEEQLNNLQKAYNLVLENMRTEIDEREQVIGELKDELKEKNEEKSDSISSFKKQIQLLEEEKQAIRKQADAKISKLQGKWMAADNKYQRLYLTSSEEQKKLKKEILDLIKARKDIYKELKQTETEYNATIDKLKNELDMAKSKIDVFEKTSVKNYQVIPQLREKIETLEKEKNAYLSDFTKRYADVQAEIKQLLNSKEQQEQQNIEWQNMVSQLIFENDYYKEVYIRRTKQEEKEYLDVIQNVIRKINTELAPSGQAYSENILREYLIRIKKAYEDLLEHERKQTNYWKEKYESEHETINEVPFDVPEKNQSIQKESDSKNINYKNKGKRRIIRGILGLCVIIGLFIILIPLMNYIKGRNANQNPSSISKNSNNMNMEKIVENTQENETETSTLDNKIPATEGIYESENLYENKESQEHQESQLPDGSIIQEALNRKKPLEKWVDIDGVNKELLSEIASVKDRVLDYYPVNEDHYESLGYQYIGEKGIFNTSYSASVGTWYERGIFQENLYNNVNMPHIQFFFNRSSTYGEVGFAVLPQDLSSKINEKTTIDELTTLFAEEPSYVGVLDAHTDFSTSNTEIAVTYDVGEYQDALFLYNENGVMCDYVYISARPDVVLE